MSTRRSARIKKVSIRCNGNVDSVSPDLSEGKETVSVAGAVAVFSNEAVLLHFLDFVPHLKMLRFNRFCFDLMFSFVELYQVFLALYI